MGLLIERKFSSIPKTDLYFGLTTKEMRSWPLLASIEIP